MREWRFYVPAGVVGALIAGIAWVASAAVAGGATIHNRPRYQYSVNHKPASQGAGVAAIKPATVPQVTGARTFSPPERAKVARR